MDVIGDEQYVLKLTGKELRLMAIALTNLIVIPNQALAGIEGAVKINGRDREFLVQMNETLLHTRASHLRNLLTSSERALERARSIHAAKDEDEETERRAG